MNLTLIISGVTLSPARKAPARQDVIEVEIPKFNLAAADPVVQPAVQEPAVVQQPAVQQPAIQQPVVQQPAAQQPAVQQPEVQAQPKQPVQQPIVQAQQPVVQAKPVPQPVAQSPEPTPAVNAAPQSTSNVSYSSSTQPTFSSGSLPFGDAQAIAMRTIQDALQVYGQSIAYQQTTDQQVRNAQEQIAALQQKNQALQAAVLGWKAKYQAMEVQNKTLKQKVETQSTEVVGLTKLCEELIAKLEKL
eukprot:TRINITY_DN825_c0_g1_i1.p2 TRINITY_DN825_c0_g1~~TRINITY_DN825_c0_g1_i1.p2  ORF type:complete len:246 (+),score=60.89 TRINITY_DN825_c0_g1_i1:1357-2094(+)